MTIVERRNCVAPETPELGQARLRPGGPQDERHRLAAEASERCRVALGQLGVEVGRAIAGLHRERERMVAKWPMRAKIIPTKIVNVLASQNAPKDNVCVPA